MPRKEDIESFNQELIKLGNEPQVARSRGELIEAIISPEAYPIDHTGPLAKVRKPAPPPEPKAVSDKTSASSKTVANENIASPAGFDDLFDLPNDDLTNTDSEKTEQADPFGDLFDDSVFSNISSTNLPETDNINLGDPFETADSSLENEDHVDTSIPDFPGDFDSLTPSEEEKSSELSTEDLVDEEDSEASRDMDSFLDNFESMVGEDAAVDEKPVPADDFELDDLSFDEPSLDAPSFDDTGIEEPNTNDTVDELSSDAPFIEDPLEPEDHTDAAESLPDLDNFDFNLPDEEVEDTPSAPPEVSPTDDTDFASFDDSFADTSDFSEEIAEAEPALDDEESPFGDLSNLSSFDASDDELPSSESVSPAKEQTPPSASGMPDFATDLDTDFGTDDFPEEFSMGDFDKEFGIIDEAKPKDDWATPDMASISDVVEEAVAATAADEAKTFEISPDDYKLIRESLSAMPLNLRIATEEVLGNPNKPFADLRRLIELLLAGESPTTIAPIVSKLYGKKIKVPAGYTKKTGRAFEEERNSFAYKFREQILPVIRTIVLAASGIFIVGWLGWTYVITPILANDLYERGLAAIRAEQYDQGRLDFNKAYKMWPDNNRYVDYAEAYSDMDQNTRAYATYKELLGDVDPKVLPVNLPEEIRDYQIGERFRDIKSGKLRFVRGKAPQHRDGIMSFANFLVDRYTPVSGSFETKFEEAITYLERLLPKSGWDRDAMLLQGDTFLEWARYLDDPTSPSPATKLIDENVLYSSEPVLMANQRLQAEASPRSAALLKKIATLHEGARFDYARLIESEGQTDLLKSKMLRYFMRSGKATQAAEITEDFLLRKTLKADPEVIAELSSALIDQAHGDLRLLDRVHTLLKRSLEQNKTNPSLFYQLTRYYNYLNDNISEEDILKNTLLAYRNFEERNPFNRDDLYAYLDTLIRAGENALKLNKPIAANDFLTEARTRYEEGLLTRKIPARSALFGRLYAVLGDISYYKKDEENTLNINYLDEAKNFYIKARENQYGVSPLTVSLNRPHPDESKVWDAFQEISYKLGYISYNLARVDGLKPELRDLYLSNAALQFLDAQGRVASENLNLRLALANTLTEAGNHEAAVGHYRILYQQLGNLRRGLMPFDPVARPNHRELIELQFTTANNLGVALYRQYRTGGLRSDELLSQAQYYMSQATTLGQNIDRDVESGIRARSVRSAYLNMDRALAPLPRDDLFIIPDILPDLKSGLLGTL